ESFEFVSGAGESLHRIGAKLRIVEVTLHVADSQRETFDRILQIVCEHRRDAHERIKLPRLFFTCDLSAQLIRYDVDIVSESAIVVTRLKDDATVELAFGDCGNVFLHACDSFRAAAHM